MAKPAPIDTIVHRAASGDEAAFAQLIDRHHASMARVAHVICGDAEAAKDAVQAAWFIAWRRLGNVRHHEQVGAWLVAIAANEARRTLRRRGRLKFVALDLAAERGVERDPMDAIGVVDLQRALLHLRPEDRMLLGLRFAAGLDSTEIARHLGLSASGVRSRLARLIERLRTDLHDD